MKNVTKAEKIRKLLSKGKSVKQIVTATGATPAYVYKVRSNLAKKPQKVEKQRAVIDSKMSQDLTARHEAKKSLWTRIKEFLCWRT